MSTVNQYTIDYIKQTFSDINKIQETIRISKLNRNFRDASISNFRNLLITYDIETGNPDHIPNNIIEIARDYEKQKNISNSLIKNAYNVTKTSLYNTYIFISEIMFNSTQDSSSIEKGQDIV